MTTTHASKINTGDLTLVSSMSGGLPMDIKAPPLRESKTDHVILASSPMTDRSSGVSGRSDAMSITSSRSDSHPELTSGRPSQRDASVSKSPGMSRAHLNNRPIKINKVVSDSSNVIRLVQVDQSLAIRKEYEKPASLNDIVISKYLESIDYNQSGFTNACVAAGYGRDAVNTDYDGLYMLQPYFRHGDSLDFVKMLTPSARHCMVLSMARRALECMAFVHKAGVIHGDVKPCNFLVNNSGELVLSDFELAIFNTSDNKPRCAMRYTTSYRAPEAVEGHVSYASDIWALGMTIYTWSRGHPLVIAEYDEPKTVCEAISKALAYNDLSPYMPCDVLISRMIHPDPSKRLTAAELLKLMDGNMTTYAGVSGHITGVISREPTLESLTCDIGNCLIGNSDVEDELEDMAPKVARYLSGTNMSPQDVAKILEFLVAVNFEVM